MAHHWHCQELWPACWKIIKQKTELVYLLYCTVILVMQKLQIESLRKLFVSFSLRCNFNRREKEVQIEYAADYERPMKQPRRLRCIGPRRRDPVVHPDLHCA